jgi:1,4-alpha-glucan branching enzyme
LLLAPSPPMLFMGEEFAASTPFLFFCDFGPELAQAVTDGRRREFARFEKFASGESTVPDPNHPDTFERSKLDWLSLDDERHAAWLAFYRKLLSLRRERIVPRLDGMRGGAGRYSTSSDAALVATWQLGDGSTLEMRLNLSGRTATAPDAPRGKLVHCEPPHAAQAFSTGELPPDAAAVYLSRTSRSSR